MSPREREGGHQVFTVVADCRDTLLGPLCGATVLAAVASLELTNNEVHVLLFM